MDYRRTIPRTKSGAPDMRTKAARSRQAQMDPHDIVQMLRLITPTARAAGMKLSEIGEEIRAFNEAHPELAEMQRRYAEAMEVNNEAVLPLFGLLAKLREVDPERAACWADYLNGKTTEEPR